MASQSRDEANEVANQVSQIVTDFWRWHFGDFSPRDSWSPSINIYRLPRRLDVCVCLAGVERRSIDVRVEPGLLIIRGMCRTPEPKRGPDEPMRIMAMEIDHGPFCREINLPDQVDLTRVESEFHHGLLWVHLPLKDQA